MATESILMAAVERGGNRQDLHERLRTYAMAARRRVIEDGRDNDYLARIAADPDFRGIDLAALADPARLAGRAAEQTDAFLADVAGPAIDRCRGRLGRSDEVTV